MCLDRQDTSLLAIGLDLQNQLLGLVWHARAKESLALELLQPELWQVWRGWHHFPRGIGAWAGSHSEVAVCGEGWAGWRGCAGPGDREASAWPLWTWC